MFHPGVGTPQVQEIAPGVFVFTKLVHFFHKIGVNAGIIQTPESIIFIDSGMSAYSGAYLWNFAKERMRGDEDLYLILTHKDSDHCFGMDEIKKHGATIIAHKYTAQIIAEEGNLSSNKIVKMIKRTYTQEVLGVPVLSVPDQIINHDTVLNLGDEIRLLVVPGHTPGDIAVYYPRSKVLFAGDAILEGIDPYLRPDSISSVTWIKNLERMKKLDIEWIHPGHGALSKPDIIDSNIQFLMNANHYARIISRGE
jgi:glyoxylase-like metal-dependent hydrolase (beta-lactamase superfamily II)